MATKSHVDDACRLSQALVGQIRALRRAHDDYRLAVQSFLVTESVDRGSSPDVLSIVGRLDEMSVSLVEAERIAQELLDVLRSRNATDISPDSAVTDRFWKIVQLVNAARAASGIVQAILDWAKDAESH